jgi:hypothetical protein
VFDRAGFEQVWDYALDLKNFHEASHSVPIVPILIATAASTSTAAGIACRWRRRLSTSSCGSPGISSLRGSSFSDDRRHRHRLEPVASRLVSPYAHHHRGGTVPLRPALGRGDRALRCRRREPSSNVMPD